LYRYSEVRAIMADYLPLDDERAFGGGLGGGGGSGGGNGVAQLHGQHQPGAGGSMMSTFRTPADTKMIPMTSSQATNGGLSGDDLNDV
jgi:hypothetical protein